MRKRWRMSRSASRRDFVRKSGVHPKNGMNSQSVTVRGGIKL